MEALFNAVGNTQFNSSNVTVAAVDEDLKLAMILQQQEQAYAQLSGHEPQFERHSLSAEANQNAPGAEAGVSDEEFARRLQQEDDRSFYQQLAMLEGEATAGHGSEETGSAQGHLDVSDDDLDIDNLDYETLQALGDAIGTVGKGLGSVGITALPTVSYASHRQGSMEGSVMDRCCICQESYTEVDEVTLLPCKHCYHPPCIQQWLAMNKVCPVCNLELVSKPTQPRH